VAAPLLPWIEFECRFKKFFRQPLIQNCQSPTRRILHSGGAVCPRFWVSGFEIRLPGSEFQSPGSRFRVRTSEFRDSGFGIRDSEFGIQDSGFGTRVSVFGIRSLVLGIRNSGFGMREPSFGIEIQDSGFGIQDSGFEIREPSFGIEIQDSGFGIQDSGFEIREPSFGIRDSGFGIQNSGFRIRDLRSEFWDSGYGTRPPRAPPKGSGSDPRDSAHHAWITTLLSNVNLPHAINFRAKFAANLVTLPPPHSPFGSQTKTKNASEKKLQRRGTHCRKSTSCQLCLVSRVLEEDRRRQSEGQRERVT